ncbi:MAG: M15 family metallopeptidase [Oscillospiraceae bacterium]
MAYRYKLKPFPILIVVLVVLLLVVLCIYVFGQKKSSDKPQGSNSTEQSSSLDTQSSSNPQSSQLVESSTDSDSSSSSANDTPVIDKTAWNLILLNRTHSLEKELPIKKIKFDGEFIDERTGESYQKMYDAAKKDGINLFLRSGYRTIALQKTYFDSNYNAYIKSGNTKENAIKLTEQYYAHPGQSEHHTGLAMDIISVEYQNQIRTLDERFAKTPAYTWLIENCTEFGFILRYPKDKVDITKINYEPWHFRYVGAEHAKYIKEHNLTLEEYLNES